MNLRGWKWLLIIVFTVFASSITAGIVLGYLPLIFRNIVSQNIVLMEGTPVFDTWISPPVPVYFEVYYFNVTNPENIWDGDTPILKEIGPFTYREFKKKIIQNWDNEKNLVSYVEEKYFHFERRKSIYDENVLVVTPNIPLISSSKYIKEKLSYLMQQIAVPVINTYSEAYNETLFLVRTIDEMLFGGYYVQMVADLMELARPFTDNIEEHPGALPNNTFGYFFKKNGSLSKPWTVSTGREGYESFSAVKSFNEKRNLNIWNTTYCNMINGTDGAQFPPFVSKDKVYVFADDICRSIYLEYEKEEVIEGILTYKFASTKSLYAENTDNLCYCTKKKRCARGGVLDLSKCIIDSPIFASSPHFLFAHDEFSANIIGLNPKIEKHQSFINIEPNTGFVIEVSKKMQINVDISPHQTMTFMSNAPEVILPVFWVKEYAKITSEKAEEFKQWVIYPIDTAKIILYAIIGSGISIIALTLFALICIKITTEVPFVLKGISLADLKKTAL